MSLWGKFKSWLFDDPRSSGTQRGSGGFDGGKVDRTNESWRPRVLTPSGEHREDSSTLRARSRDLYNNNPIARSVVEAYCANVIDLSRIKVTAFVSEQEVENLTVGQPARARLINGEKPEASTR